jgi:hypothetical protein
VRLGVSDTAARRAGILGPLRVPLAVGRMGAHDRMWARPDMRSIENGRLRNGPQQVREESHSLACQALTMCRWGVNRVANFARYLWKSVEADICLAQVAQCRGHDLIGGVVFRH